MKGRGRRLGMRERIRNKGSEGRDRVHGDGVREGGEHRG